MIGGIIDRIFKLTNENHVISCNTVKNIHQS
jgi:hypothetical protein